MEKAPRAIEGVHLYVRKAEVLGSVRVAARRFSDVAFARIRGRHAVCPGR